jgi:drug/metabolite transporter (DMT)-like permease
LFPAFLAAFFFASSATIAQHTTRLVGVFAANFARLWVAAFLLGAWALIFGSGLRGAALPIFLLGGAVGFGMGDLGLFAALPRLGTRLTALMVQCLAAPFAALIEWLWLGTKLDTLELVCAGLILLGVGIALAPDERAQAARAARHPTTAAERRAGVAFGWIAALGQGGGAVISRKAYLVAAAAGEHIDGGTAAWQRSLGGLVVVTFAFGLSRRWRQPGDAQRTAPQWRAAWPWIAANALVGAALGVSCYQWALASTPSAIVLPIVALTPLLVLPFSFFLEHERPSARSLAGGAVAVAAAAALARVR